MSNPDDYVSLITGLPNPERLFLAKISPLSRIKLEQKLKVLSTEHRKTLHDIETMLDWRLQSSEYSDQFISQRCRQLYAQLTSRTLRTIVRDKLELRTCIAALRLRAQGDEAPEPREWGFGRWVQHIARNWHEENFNLEHIYPWLPKAQQLIVQYDPEPLERFILEKAFTQLQRFSIQHYFDFEAVVIYVLKWNIIDRSVCYNTEVAKQRFSMLVSDAVKAFETTNLESDG